MPSTEVEVKLSQLAEEFFMLVNSLLNQLSKSPSFFARSRPLMMLSEEFIRLSHPEEVLSSVKSQFPELHLST